MVGIESINAYLGRGYIEIEQLFKHRGLDLARYENLLLNKKSIAFPFEDVVTNAVNAAKPLVKELPNQGQEVRMLITATESGLDLGKSASTYIHQHLGLSSDCRLLEFKQACYSGVGAMQLACAYVSSVPNAGKVLVVASDVARPSTVMAYGEPTQASGAVAFLVGDSPRFFIPDSGAEGFHSFEVMDTFRPDFELEAGNPDISVMAYLDCLSGAFGAYSKRVDADFARSFDALVFHAPFGGLVKGAHRHLVRKLKCFLETGEIERDFQHRVAPSLLLASEVGNIYSASVFLALISAVVNRTTSEAIRIGMFAYGSGCTSEFLSGIVPKMLNPASMLERSLAQLRSREVLSMDLYDRILSDTIKTLKYRENATESELYFRDYSSYFEGRDLLTLQKIVNFKRHYCFR
jgi:polyketide biosynthesis 3-hydroxy-3-methylglutaryl-CoA synthase-like enzyme PksG